MIELSQKFTAMYYHAASAALYYAYDGKLWRWDDPGKPYGQFDWMSKTMVTKDYMNLGAARVIADYGSNPNDALIADQNAATLVSNQNLITTKKTGGSIGGSCFGGVAVGGSLLKPLQAVNVGIQFQLYVDKDLIFSTQITDDLPFRLPTGYRSDTFSVRVTGNTRVRAIHLGETPWGLDKV